MCMIWLTLFVLLSIESWVVWDVGGSLRTIYELGYWRNPTSIRELEFEVIINWRSEELAGTRLAHICSWSY